MRAVFIFICVFSCAAFAAGPGGKPITVVLDFEKAHSELSLSVMQTELQSILRGAGLRPQVVLKNELPSSPQPGNLVVFRMKGSCSMESVLPLGALSDERGPLAMTYESDGQLLSFGAVECDRVRQSLRRVSHASRPERADSTFGRAVARVVAHEMYHMIANSATHTSSGLTKESLSSQDLSDHYWELPNQAKQALRRASSQ